MREKKKRTRASRVPFSISHPPIRSPSAAPVVSAAPEDVQPSAQGVGPQVGFAPSVDPVEIGAFKDPGASVVGTLATPAGARDPVESSRLFWQRKTEGIRARGASPGPQLVSNPLVEAGLSEEFRGREGCAIAPLEDSADAAGVRERESVRRPWQQESSANRTSDVGRGIAFSATVYGANRLNIPASMWTSSADEWSCSLVGYVFGMKPPLGSIQGFIRAKWRLGRAVSVAQLKPGVFLFRFVSAVVRDRILDKGPWSFDNRPLVLRIWSPTESFDWESAASLPLWVRFPGLAPHLRRPDILGLVCSTVGKPIRTDGFTAGVEKLEYARVLIEVFAAREFKNSVVIVGPEGIPIVQKIEYDWRPPRCSECLLFGHSVKQCRIPKAVFEEDGSGEDNVDILEEVERSMEASVNDIVDDGVPLRPGCVPPVGGLESSPRPPKVVAMGSQVGSALAAVEPGVEPVSVPEREHGQGPSGILSPVANNAECGVLAACEASCSDGVDLDELAVARIFEDSDPPSVGFRRSGKRKKEKKGSQESDMHECLATWASRIKRKQGKIREKKWVGAA